MSGPSLQQESQAWSLYRRESNIHRFYCLSRPRCSCIFAPCLLHENHVTEQTYCGCSCCNSTAQALHYVQLPDLIRGGLGTGFQSSFFQYFAFVRLHSLEDQPNKGEKFLESIKCITTTNKALLGKVKVWYSNCV